MNNLKKNSIIQNIQISDAMKDELYRGCVEGKRTKKLSYMPSKKILVASLALCVVVASGVTASAAITHWRDRMKEMPEEVVEEYREIANTKEEGRSYTRNLTEEEHHRMIALLDEYHNGHYPEQNVPVYDTLDQLPEGTMGYVKEVGLICLPETTLTDEQLLEMLDYNEKITYSVVGMPETDEPVIHFDDSLTEDDAERIKEISIDAIKKYFDYDATEALECVIDSYTGYVEGEYENKFLVNIISNELGTDVAFVILDQATAEPISVGLGGWGKYYQSKTAAEMEANMDSYVEACENFLHKFFADCGESKSIHYRMMCGEGGQEAETLMLLFEMEQGYYMVEVSAYDASIDSFSKFKSRAGYEDQLSVIEYKKVK